MDKTPEELAKEIFDKQLVTENERKELIREKLFNKLDSQVRKVTAELFAKFLHEKGASRTCLSCGSDKLSVPETSTVDRAKLPDNFSELSIDEQGDAMVTAMIRFVSYTFIDDEAMPRLGNVKYQVNCLNCGFISQYRAHPVVSWVLDQEEVSKDE